MSTPTTHLDMKQARLALQQSQVDFKQAQNVVGRFLKHDIHTGYAFDEAVAIMNAHRVKVCDLRDTMLAHIRKAEAA